MRKIRRRIRRVITWKRVVLLMASGVVLFGFFILWLIRDLPTADTIAQRIVAQATILYDRTGETALYDPVRDDAETRLAIPLGAGDGLDKHTRLQLRKEEQRIAKKYMSTPQQMRIYTVITVGCFLAWLSFFPLTMLDILPVWPCFIASCVFAAGGYITSHEAMHDNIGRRGTKYRFWNELVGEISTIILIFPFSMARMMHLHHHYHCNHPENDPDYTDEAPSAFKAWIKTWLNRQPGADGSIHHYKRVLERIGTKGAQKALRDTMMLQLFAMAEFGD